jgi:hypothetical protein
MASENGTHSGFRNVTGKFTSNTVQKPQNQKREQFRGGSLKSKVVYILITAATFFAVARCLPRYQSQTHPCDIYQPLAKKKKKTVNETQLSLWQ